MQRETQPLKSSYVTPNIDHAASLVFKAEQTGRSAQPVVVLMKFGGIVVGGYLSFFSAFPKQQRT